MHSAKLKLNSVVRKRLVRMEFSASLSRKRVRSTDDVPSSTEGQRVDGAQIVAKAGLHV